MRSCVLGVAVVCVMAFLVVGCGKSQPAKPAAGAGTMNQPEKQAGPPAPPASNVEQEKNSLVESATQKLDQLKKDVEDLGAKARATGGKVETDWTQNVKPQLDKDVASAQKALDDAKSAAVDTWAAAKDGLNKALGQLQGAYDKAKSNVNASPGAGNAPPGATPGANE